HQRRHGACRVAAPQDERGAERVEGRLAKHRLGTAAADARQRRRVFEEVDDALEVVVPGEKTGELLDPIGVGERALPPLGRAAERPIGERADDEVLERAIVHDSAARMRPTLLSSTAAVSPGENASKVTAWARGQRATARAAKASISSDGSAGAIHGPCRSGSSMTPA